MADLYLFSDLKVYWSYQNKSISSNHPEYTDNQLFDSLTFFAEH